jgi:transposase
MSNYYDDRTIVHFEDLKKLVREEVGKLIVEVREQTDKQKQQPKPLSIQELADRYEVSKATVHNWRKQGLVTGFKIGKGRFFHLEEVEKNLKQYRYLDVLERKGLHEFKKFY